MKKTPLFLTALYLLIGLLSGLLSGCVTAPKELAANNFALTAFAQIPPQGANPNRGITARLGGKVLQAQAGKQRTRLEVLSLPVADFTAKPLPERQADGRFIAYIDGFVDPEILKNQYVTLGGTLAGSEWGKIDQADYRYPILHVRHYRLWRVGMDYVDDADWHVYDGVGRWERWHRHYPPQIRYYLY